MCIRDSPCIGPADAGHLFLCGRSLSGGTPLETHHTSARTENLLVDFWSTDTHSFPHAFRRNDRLGGSQSIVGLALRRIDRNHTRIRTTSGLYFSVFERANPLQHP